MNPHTIIIIALGLIEILLALYVFARYQKTSSIFSLVAFLVSIGIMSILVGAMPFIDAGDDRLLVGKFAFLAGAATFASLFSIALYFPLPSPIGKNAAFAYTFVPLFVVAYLIFLSGSFLDRVDIENNLARAYPGAMFWVFTTLTALYLLAAFFFMVRKIPIVGGQLRSQVKIFSWLILITGILGILNDNFFPILGMYRSPLGLEAGGLIALYVASVVLKKNPG